MTTLQSGDTAPAFIAKDQDGNTIKSQDYLGKKVILFFYPKANTSGCTAEACNLSENYSLLQKKGFEIIGISADDEKKQKSFKSKFLFPYPLIADPEKEVIKSYGVWGEKKMYGKSYEGIFRTTFIIDEKGKIMHVITKVKTKDHSQQIIDELTKLNLI